MKQNRACEFDSLTIGAQGNGVVKPGNLFEQQFIQQLLAAVKPEIKALIREVIADERGQPLVVGYEEAGRMVGTTYEGIRKLVRKGKLTAVSRSGRNRGIAVSELKDYVQRNQLLPEWYSSSFRASGNG
jgi:hypothetical protein